jgi:hypothetical protein
MFPAFNSMNILKNQLKIKTIQTKMKKILILAILTILGAIPAWSQTTSSTSTNTGGGGELREKLKAMSPAERQEFLKNHPEIRERVRAAMLKNYENMTPAQKQQFTQTHPQVAQRLSNASEAGAGTKDPGHPRVNEVNQREGNQQQRINQGVNNGSLTSQEDARLQKGEQRIQNQESRDLTKNDGHLTEAEQRRLNGEEDRESRRIYRAKHN